MASNLVHEAGRYRWRLDFDGMEALLRDFFATDLWQVVEDPPAGTVLHFVKANDSHVLSEDGCARIEAAGARHGRAHLHRVAGGHWVHVENPDAVLGLLLTHLQAHRRPACLAEEPPRLVRPATSPGACIVPAGWKWRSGPDPESGAGSP